MKQAIEEQTEECERLRKYLTGDTDEDNDTKEADEYTIHSDSLSDELLADEISAESVCGRKSHETKNNRLKIGIDYGGVCSVKSDNYEENPSDQTAARDITMPGCLESLTRLAEKHDLYLISFCGKRTAVHTGWLLKNKYSVFTGMYFVKDKKFKNMVCEALGIDVMIDDRIDVLETIHTAHLIHFIGDPSYKGPRKHKKLLAYHLDSWLKVEQCIEQLPSKNRQMHDTLDKSKIYQIE